jgi:hypothetical protein
MIRRLLCACMGVVLVAVLTVPTLALAEQRADEPGVEPMVSGLMKACHLLMNQGMYHQAAELARQAYALDPERVQGDPLIYKMHLLSEAQEDGTHEESVPQTCPYCPRIGKPIGGIVPEKKMNEVGDSEAQEPPSAIDYDFDVSASRGLRVCAECTVGDSVYHLRFQRGCLAIWKTTNAGKTAR